MIPFGIAATAAIKPKFMNAAFFGASGLGIRDEQPYLQNAIDFCISKNIPNLKINTGTYLLTSLAPKTGNGYHRDYLQVGYTPTQPNRANLTLIGNGTPVLCGDKRFIPGSVGYISLLGLKENINNFKVDNITFKWDGNLVGDTDNSAAGIWITNNQGGNFLSNYPINRNRIDIINSTFVNCHRSINGGSAVATSTVIPGSGTDVVLIDNNQFLYPKGSDSSSLAGGGQITLFYADTKHLIVTNNYAEGSSTVPVDCPNGLPKDGFTFGGGLYNIVANNIIKGTWVESVIATPSYLSMYIPYSFDIPSVGNQVTFRLGNKTAEPDRTFFDALTSQGRLGINDIAGCGTPPNIAGIYRIDEFTSNKANLSVIVTRLSGEEYGGVYLNKLTRPTGSAISNGFLTPFGLSKELGSYSRIHDNNFVPGLAIEDAIGWGNRTSYAHAPAIRGDGGYYSISGNNLNSILAITVPSDPTTFWTIENNDFYVYNQNPNYPDPTDGSTTKTSIAVNLCSCIVRNNEFTFWTNITGGIATDVNSNRVYLGNALHYGVFGAVNSQEKQIVIDNKYYCTVPSQSNRISQTQNSTINDVITGNQVINV